MGVLVPEDFDVASLRNEEERRVVDACVHGLSDGWLVLPSVGLKVGTRDRELDIVLVHEGFGVVVIEVKGHRPQVRGGAWFSHGSRMEPQPFDQAHQNAYALRSFLRSKVDGLNRMRVPYGVALPNVAELDGRLAPDIKPEQLITAPMLEDMADAVERLALMWATTQLLDHEEAEQIVQLLRPDCEFTWEPGARAAFARRRLDELCAAQVRPLETLDRNRRVVVLGPAGTGKTRLAEGWARRALADEQRVLFTSYNEPLADAVARRLPDDEDLVVGPFLRLALGLPGMAPLPIPEDADHDWWTVTVPAHLEANWSGVTARFDTIVVDEGQDFAPRWLALLEELLDPEGADRLLIVADPAQELYVRGFEVPDAAGWTTCELVTNCRNAHQIARLVRRRLGGAAAPAVAPEAIDVRFQPAPEGDLAALADLVAEELRWLVEDEDRDPARIAVLTFRGAARDHLHAGIGLARWEDRADDDVLGENVHRAKGLEFDTVILAADGDVADDLLYVGASRAISELVVIAPTAVGDRLALT